MMGNLLISGTEDSHIFHSFITSENPLMLHLSVHNQVRIKMSNKNQNILFT